MSVVKYKDGNTWKEYPTIISTQLTDGVTLYEYGKLCVLEVTVTNLSIASGKTYTIATLPERIVLQDNVTLVGRQWNASKGLTAPLEGAIGKTTNKIGIENYGANGAGTITNVRGQAVFINYGS